MLQKGNQRACNTHRLLRRHVHIVHDVSTLQEELALVTSQHTLLYKLVTVREFRVGLGDPEVLLIVGGIIFHLATHKGPRRDLGAPQYLGELIEERFIDTNPCTSLDKKFATWRLNIFVFPPKDPPELAPDQAAVIRGQVFVDFAIGCLDEAVWIDGRIGCQVPDQADVLAIRRLNRADTAVVGLVYVSDFEACTVAGEPTRTKCRETTFETDLGQSIRLVHELGEP